MYRYTYILVSAFGTKDASCLTYMLNMQPFARSGSALSGSGNPRQLSMPSSVRKTHVPIARWVSVSSSLSCFSHHHVKSPGTIPDVPSALGAVPRLVVDLCKHLVPRWLASLCKRPPQADGSPEAS